MFPGGKSARDSTDQELTSGRYDILGFEGPKSIARLHKTGATRCMPPLLSCSRKRTWSNSLRSQGSHRKNNNPAIDSWRLQDEGQLDQDIQRGANRVIINPFNDEMEPQDNPIRYELCGLQLLSPPQCWKRTHVV